MGLPFSVLYMFVKDSGTRHAGGFMVGFDITAWAVVALQVVAGAVSAVLVRGCYKVAGPP